MRFKRKSSPSISWMPGPVSCRPQDLTLNYLLRGSEKTQACRYARVLREVLYKAVAWDLTKPDTAGHGTPYPKGVRDQGLGYLNTLNAKP